MRGEEHAVPLAEARGGAVVDEGVEVARLAAPFVADDQIGVAVAVEIGHDGCAGAFGQ